MKIKWSDIRKIPKAYYTIDQPLNSVVSGIQRYIDSYNLDIDPDFQRGHVWTEAQQIAYMEWLIMGGETGRELVFNHPNWMGSFEGYFVLIDGKQRLNAIKRFFNNKIKVFGENYYKDFDMFPWSETIKFKIMKLKTRADILRWYLDFNSGGTVHSKEDIDKVVDMLNKELSK